MWIPSSAAELETALQGAGLVETDALDGKAAIPKNPELAVDICAMTPDGGVLLFGVDENADGTRLVTPTPIPLAGERERIDQVAQTCISEPPVIRTVPFECDTRSGHGYLAVFVPQSARAPHQVTVKGRYHGRFYGRGDATNRVLTQGEIERLYRRRQTWERDLLEEANDAFRTRAARAFHPGAESVCMLLLASLPFAVPARARR